VVQQEAAEAELFAKIQSVLSEAKAELACDIEASVDGGSRRTSAVLTREQELGGGGTNCNEPEKDSDSETKFLPAAPRTLGETGLSEADLSALIMKQLLALREANGATLADRVALPFPIVSKQLATLKSENLVGLKASSAAGDFVYQLTPVGEERAATLRSQDPYVGVAPVAFQKYVESVEAQSLTRFRPSREALAAAFSDLTLGEEMLNRLGRAILSGKGLFLHGAPGNGKTSIAERITKAYGQSIWIPRMVVAAGEIIQVFDPSNHEEIPLLASNSLANDGTIDRRWIRIRRPTIVAGGELTMENLEITVRPGAGSSEAPMQLKSNCGTLVIDDFGRQRVSPAELLNRWIVPLEKRFDILNLANGCKIRVPFDQFLVFSTNLEPRDLIDEAFLRRIPYKIDAKDPEESQFQDLFELLCGKMGVEFSEEGYRHLIENHYRPHGKPYRFCHPRDLLQQVKVYCEFEGERPAMTIEAIDMAASDYFTVL